MQSFCELCGSVTQCEERHQLTEYEQGTTRTVLSILCLQCRTEVWCEDFAPVPGPEEEESTQ